MNFLISSIAYLLINLLSLEEVIRPNRKVHKVKRIRAHGGCLGTRSR